MLASFRDTLLETMQLEDYEETGEISLAGFREAFQALGVEGVDEEMLEFFAVLLYGRAQSVDRLPYGQLFELLEKRPRPESSSPEKLKARNQEQEPAEEYEEEEFEKMLDKTEEEPNEDEPAEVEPVNEEPGEYQAGEEPEED